MRNCIKISDNFDAKNFDAKIFDVKIARNFGTIYKFYKYITQVSGPYVCLVRAYILIPRGPRGDPEGSKEP